jgi:hypothetical protein
MVELESGTKIKITLNESGYVTKLDIDCKCGNGHIVLETGAGTSWYGWGECICSDCDEHFWYSHKGDISEEEPEKE